MTSSDMGKLGGASKSASKIEAAIANGVSAREILRKLPKRKCAGCGKNKPLQRFAGNRKTCVLCVAENNSK